RNGSVTRHARGDEMVEPHIRIRIDLDDGPLLGAWSFRDVLGNQVEANMDGIEGSLTDLNGNLRPIRMNALGDVRAFSARSDIGNAMKLHVLSFLEDRMPSHVLLRQVAQHHRSQLDEFGPLIRVLLAIFILEADQLVDRVFSVTNNMGGNAPRGGADSIANGQNAIVVAWAIFLDHDRLRPGATCLLPCLLEMWPR